MTFRQHFLARLLRLGKQTLRLMERVVFSPAMAYYPPTGHASLAMGQQTAAVHAARRLQPIVRTSSAPGTDSADGGTGSACHQAVCTGHNYG